MTREISSFKVYVMKLELRVSVRKKQTLELKYRSIENHVIISGFEEKALEKQNENVAKIVRDMLSFMDLHKEEFDSLHILNLFRLEKDPKRKYPRWYTVFF